MNIKDGIIANTIMTLTFMLLFSVAAYNFAVGKTLAADLEVSFEKAYVKNHR